MRNLYLRIIFSTVKRMANIQITEGILQEIPSMKTF